MTALWALTVANIKSYTRDRAALFWTLAFPLIFIFMFGFIFQGGGGGGGLQIGWVDEDGSPASAALRAAFDATYTRVYGRVIPRLEVEAVTWTLSLAEPHDLPERLTEPPDAGMASATGRCQILETTSGETVEAAQYVRAALPKGVRVIGPAIIVETGTSTIIPSGYSARIGAGDDIVIEEIEA